MWSLEAPAGLSLPQKRPSRDVKKLREKDGGGGEWCGGGWGGGSVLPPGPQGQGSLSTRPRREHRRGVGIEHYCAESAISMQLAHLMASSEY